MKIDKTDTGLVIHLNLEPYAAEIIRRALMMILKVIEQRYEVSRKVFLPEE